MELHLSSAIFFLIVVMSAWTLFSTIGEAKVFSKCDFVAEAKKHFPVEQIDKWTCIARYESNFNTDAINTGNWDNSTDHGIFQINDRYWCSPGPANICNVSCEALRSENLTEAIACAQRILSIQGFSAWTVYPLYCNNSFNYSQDCNTPGSDFSSRKFSFSFAAPPSLFNPLDSRVAADRNVITAVSRITTPYVKNTALPSPTGGPIIKGTIGSISTYLSYSTTKASPAALQNDLSSSTTDLGVTVSSLAFSTSSSGIYRDRTFIATTVPYSSSTLGLGQNFRPGPQGTTAPPHLKKHIQRNDTSP
ncbi:uncharacterized protein LOC111253676 isoform X1 [Varroa destructor]|uniref:lysozyme n=1 Tax=Varroa destructor TaxID=109461 RepID=A0A7M7KQ90_VARDE|nr:uncharacterized protein LOC111253676 isoform X1 [Varroa destructor]